MRRRFESCRGHQIFSIVRKGFWLWYYLTQNYLKGLRGIFVARRFRHHLIHATCDVDLVAFKQSCVEVQGHLCGFVSQQVQDDLQERGQVEHAEKQEL